MWQAETITHMIRERQDFSILWKRLENYMSVTDAVSMSSVYSAYFEDVEGKNLD